MKRVLVGVWVGLVCLPYISRGQAQQGATQEDQLGKQARQQVMADPDAPNRTMQAPSEVVPQLVVPRLVKFSGMANDELGKPRTGTVGITFAIYKDREGGAPLWLETQNIGLDEQGRYTVLLGATKSEGLPLELFTAGESRWLGVQVQLPGELEQPRVLLVSVPYALKAADAETLGGLPASAFALATPSGTVTGASVPSTTTQTSANSKTAGKAATSRTAKSAAAAATPVAANFIPVFIDNSGTLGSSAMFQSGSNIGIGTTTPGATLDVNGGTRALSYLFSGNAATPTDATATIFNQANVGPTFSGLSFSVRTGAPTPANALTVDAGQNVTIAGNTNMGGNAAALAYKFTGNAAMPSDATATILNAANVGPVFSGLSFRVRTGSPPADALTVAPNQNVGIGTTTPADRLDVFGPASDSDGQAIFVLGGSSTGTAGTAQDGIDSIGGNASGTNGSAGFGVFATGGNATAATGGTGGDGGDFIGGSSSGTSGFGGFGVFATGGNATAAGAVAGDGGEFDAGIGSNGAKNGFAGFFSGDIQVTGAITAGTKDFKIDHPLDPANKYLAHASVESSEMLNMYTGNATLDASGSASVPLPGWFEVLNKDFRYQLTAIGAPGPNLYIAQEIQGGYFVIAGGQPGMKVSWQVTGVRQDAFAKAYPLVVEEEKLAIERGHYIHPELYGAPEEAGIQWARHPQLMKKMKDGRAKQAQVAPAR